MVLLVSFDRQDKSMPTVIPANPSTISDLLKRSSELNDASDTPRLDIEILLSYVLEKDRSFLYAWSDHYLSDQQKSRFEALFERRIHGEPVAHLTGTREFWSLPLRVSPATLIPRPETELLVERILSLPLSEQSSVLDLGTGTGAIALALASEKPRWNITAVDTVYDAVQLAEENRQQLGFDNVQVYQSDWFSRVKQQQFDVVVSNPPYICAGDEHLQQGDVRFEPVSALVADDLGLSDIRTIVSAVHVYLKSGGWLLLEHGFDQGLAVRQIMLRAGFDEVMTYTDFAGLDRVSVCRSS
jgi:release factor glutamine methyltransferase